MMYTIKILTKYLCTLHPYFSCLKHPPYCPAPPPSLCVSLGRPVPPGSQPCCSWRCSRERAASPCPPRRPVRKKYSQNPYLCSGLTQVHLGGGQLHSCLKHPPYCSAPPPSLCLSLGRPGPPGSRPCCSWRCSSERAAYPCPPRRPLLARSSLSSPSPIIIPHGHQTLGCSIYDRFGLEVGSITRLLLNIERNFHPSGIVTILCQKRL